MKTDYIRKRTPEQKERLAIMDKARHLRNKLKKLHDNEEKTPIQSIEYKTPIQSIEVPVYMDYDTSKYSDNINAQLKYARENYPMFKYNEILKYTITK